MSYIQDARLQFPDRATRVPTLTLTPPPQVPQPPYAQYAASNAVDAPIPEPTPLVTVPGTDGTLDHIACGPAEVERGGTIFIYACA